MGTRSAYSIYLTDKELVNRAFGEVVAFHRKAADYTQRGFSRVLGISNSHLRGIEKGTVSPRHVTVVQIALVLGVEPGQLVDEAYRLAIEYSSKKPGPKQFLP